MNAQEILNLICNTLLLPIDGIEKEPKNYLGSKHAIDLFCKGEPCGRIETMDYEIQELYDFSRVKWDIIYQEHKKVIDDEIDKTYPNSTKWPYMHPLVTIKNENEDEIATAKCEYYNDTWHISFV